MTEGFLDHRGRRYSYPSETPVSSRCLGWVLMRHAGSLDSRQRKLKTWGDLNGHGCGLWKQKMLSGLPTTRVGEVEFSPCRRPLHLITGVSRTCSQEKPGSSVGKKKHQLQCQVSKAPVPQGHLIHILWGRHFTNGLHSFKSLSLRCDCWGRGKRDAGRFLSSFQAGSMTA